MVRPENCMNLTGASPVLVITGEPGSRPQFRGVILGTAAGRQEPQLEGAKKRAVTLSESCSLVKVSAERCLGGPSRSCHGEGNRQSPVKPEREWTSPGYGRRHVSKGEYGTGETLLNSQRRAKPSGIRPKTEITRSWEGVRGAHGTDEGGKNKPLEGRGSASVVTVKGKCEGMPRESVANNPVEQSTRTLLQSMDASQVARTAQVFTPRHTFSGDASERTPGIQGRKSAMHATCRKTVGKPCAGNPQARFERGVQETGGIAPTGA